MEETVFFILGIGLVVAALVLSAIGLRSERFPPSGALTGAMAGAFAVLVVATGAFAWIQAAEHQREHAPELAEKRAERAEELAAQQREEIAAEEGAAQEGAAPQEGAADADAVQTFDSAGCGGCHTLEAAGTTATVGPDLDEALQGRSRQFIEQSIVDPNAEIAQGFSPDVMPGTYQEQLSPEEIEALVDLLHQGGS